LLVLVMVMVMVMGADDGAGDVMVLLPPFR
jgi:hypothetical protein